jgi:hypothetical protein
MHGVDEDELRAEAQQPPAAPTLHAAQARLVLEARPVIRGDGQLRGGAPIPLQAEGLHPEPALRVAREQRPRVGRGVIRRVEDAHGGLGRPVMAGGPVAPPLEVHVVLARGLQARRLPGVQDRHVPPHGDELGAVRVARVLLDGGREAEGPRSIVRAIEGQPPAFLAPLLDSEQPGRRSPLPCFDAHRVTLSWQGERVARAHRHQRRSARDVGATPTCPQVSIDGAACFRRRSARPSTLPR